MLIEGFKSSFERIQDEDKFRQSIEHTGLKFGISFLDDALRGIISTDLILLCASSGVGKTEMAANIAYKNAKAGKKVYGIFLEAFEGEIELRQKYRLISEKARMDKVSTRYADWLQGKQRYLSDKYKVDLEFFKNVHTKYRTRNYTIDDLKKDLLAVNDSADLIVIDHLHYFDLTSEKENEEMTSIVKTISDIIQIIKKPVVLVTHIRKRGMQSVPLAPDLEDIHGSSNIYKIATKVITVASAGAIDKNTSQTYMRIPKYRLDSSVTNFVCDIKYLHDTNDYDRSYTVGKQVMIKNKAEFEQLDYKPHWINA